ncbi:MAG: hypothetical protein KF841_00790 [Phycisphaerae bacterium]|nr:hypothetical protein [Phycisphaerae bacterium]
MRTESQPVERHDPVTARPESLRATGPTGETFACEEGESMSATPIPGLIGSRRRHGQTVGDRHYTSGIARPPAQWEPDLTAARTGWTEEDGAALQMPGMIVDQNAATVSLEVEQPTRATSAKGLCATCELRETCTFPRPESGVWRCEEYR